MEILDSTDAIFVVDEDLLNFQLDDVTPTEIEKTVSPLELETTFNNNGDTTPFCLETGGFFPEMEEELEWLSNKDAFPAVETCFGILNENPEFIIHHESPISVLENSTSFNSNGVGNVSSVTSCCESLKVPTTHPVRARSKRRRSRRKAMDFIMHPYPVIAKSKTSASSVGRRCLHCQTDTTPQWRAGPMGPKTLCNACGVRYKSGRLLPEYRPANSPTFASGVHSNSHRKVVEMRKKKQVPMIGDGVFASDGFGYMIG